jgi:hypothetical protein
MKSVEYNHQGRLIEYNITIRPGVRAGRLFFVDSLFLCICHSYIPLMDIAHWANPGIKGARVPNAGLYAHQLQGGGVIGKAASARI